MAFLFYNETPPSFNKTNQKNDQLIFHPCLKAAADKTTYVLRKLKTSEDQQFDVVCLDNRLKSLFPVLESTEKFIRKNSLTLNRPKLTNDLENSTSGLWNSIVILMKQEFSSKFIKTLCEFKFFCCLMLSLHESLVPAFDSKMRVIKCLLKTFNLCVDERQTGLCKRVQDYVELLFMSIDKSSLSDAQMKTYMGIGVDLSIADMQYSVTQNDIPMAKFYENRADVVSNMLIVSSIQLTNICRFTKIKELIMSKVLIELKIVV
ncbi:unnamed protein product [Ambrosiozyma monospora]|uniref:Unnamed protein product n=1 Tax=Ambrosiozyma monospora TaxID=43982 RepID=A0ACB5TBV0_AMBMO|nr:unnamed protein product [Ambrosiozyma monospora]